MAFKLETKPDCDLPLLLEAVHESRKIAMKYFKKNPQIWIKKGNSPVSEADYAIDRYLREKLTSARPDYSWISEEMPDKPVSRPHGKVFVVDPLDGTRGFLNGQSTWCVSVAVVQEGRTLTAVLDCPMIEETYVASFSGGATLNGVPLRVRNAEKSFEVLGPRSMFDSLPDSWKKRVSFVEPIPSLAYRLALVACGRLDAVFVKPHAYDWDLAGVDLILHEAGGRLVEKSGAPPRYVQYENNQHQALAAGSGAFLNEMINVL